MYIRAWLDMCVPVATCWMVMRAESVGLMERGMGAPRYADVSPYGSSKGCIHRNAQKVEIKNESR